MLLPRSQRPYTRARRTSQGRQIRPGFQAPILIPASAAPAPRQGCLTAATRLDAGFLVGANHSVARGKRRTLPTALVEIEYPGGLALKVRVARKDPTTVRPRTDRILSEPAPQGRFADGGDQPTLDDLAADLWQAPARQRHFRFMRQFAGQRFNGYREAWGGRALGARCGRVPQGLRYVLGRSACAIC